MSVFSDLGISGVEGINLSGTLSTILIIIGIFLVVIVIGSLTFMRYFKKYKKKSFKNQVPIFASIAGKHQRIGLDWAKELFVPDSNISLFYLKDKKIYLARPTRSMGKDEYWYYIPENGEWVNFVISSSPKDNSLAIANYDHRDTRYAYVNLKDIIKKNYKDKAVQWWKEYSGVITIVIVGLMFIGAMAFFFWRTGKMMDQLAPIAENLKLASEFSKQAVSATQNINSGIIQG